MHWKWASLAIMPALMALTLTAAGVPRAAVAAAPPECAAENAVLGGCPTTDCVIFLPCSTFQPSGAAERTFPV